MIKPKILNDEELKPIFSREGYQYHYITPAHKIMLEAQNDYCYKEMLGQFEELIDRYMANGRYKAPWDDVMVNCISGDVEYIWGQLKQALQGLEEG